MEEHVDIGRAERRAVNLTGPVVLVGGEEHPYASGRLRAGLKPIECLPASGLAPSTTRTAIHLRLDPGLPEGAYQIEVKEGGDGVAIDLVGGPFSGVIQAAEALLRVAEPESESVSVPIGRIQGEPALAYRTLWTWDHSTHWDVDSFGMQETGAFNPYGKQPDAFVSDYRRMIDFMSLYGIGGVVIYGLLRDSHGGVEAANEVCRYARERGVRVLAGFAVNSYGGVYYEGRHPYNLATWLRQHPEFLVDTSSLPGFTINDYGYLGFPFGDYTLASRSDRPEMERWHLDGLDWLLDSVDIDGINFEFGDYAGNDAHEDMRRLLPGLLDRARANRNDLWLIAELGWDFVAEPDAPERVAGLPPGCAYQFTYNRSYWPTLRSRLTPEAVAALPTDTKLIRPHAGSQWNRQRYTFMAAHYMELAQLAKRTELDGATVFGEVSDYNPPNELNYLAFARFSIEADLTWERFMGESVAPRLGGADAAYRYISLLERLDGDLLDTGGLQAARDEVRQVAASLPDPARGRWSWLEERISRRIHSRLGR